MSALSTSSISSTTGLSALKALNRMLNCKLRANVARIRRLLTSRTNVKRLLCFLLGAALAASAFAQDKKPAKKAAAPQAEKPADKAIPTENFHAQCIGCH